MASFSALHWVIFGVLVLIIFTLVSPLLSRLFNPATTKVCTMCGHAGKPVMRVRGSMLIEIVLWLCLIVPGLIYSLWRLGSKHQACAACGAATLVPSDSPVGRKLLADFKPPAA